MLMLGLAGMFVGPFANHFLFLQDWWHPLYIMGTRGGIEDMLLGFTNMGIVAVVYEELFNRKYTRVITSKKLHFNNALFKFSMWGFVTVTPVLLLFFVFKIHSFWSNTLGLLLGGIFVLINRPDLLKDSLWSSVLMPLVSLPAFIIPEILSPGWIVKYWMMQNLSKITFLYAPIEDLIWYSLVGFCFGSLFEYVFSFKIKD